MCQGAANRRREYRKFSFNCRSFLFLVLNFVYQKSPHFDDKNLGLLVQDHLNVVEDVLGGAARQHLRADEVGERGLRLPDVLGNLLVDPRPDALLHKLIVHQVPVHHVLEQGRLLGRDLLDQRLDVFFLVVGRRRWRLVTLSGLFVDGGGGDRWQTDLELLFGLVVVVVVLVLVENVRHLHLPTLARAVQLDGVDGGLGGGGRRRRTGDLTRTNTVVAVIVAVVVVVGGTGAAPVGAGGRVVALRRRRGGALAVARLALPLAGRQKLAIALPQLALEFGIWILEGRVTKDLFLELLHLVHLLAPVLGVLGGLTLPKRR